MPSNSTLPPLPVMSHDRPAVALAAETLFSLGYCPQLVSRDKQILVKHNGQQVAWTENNFVPKALTLSAALHTSCGLSVNISRFQTYDWRPFDIDVDLKDPAYLAALASLLPKGAPSWRGLNAGHLLFKCKNPHELLQPTRDVDKLLERSIFFKGHKLRIGWIEQVGKKANAVEFLSMQEGKGHAILPPTIHREATELAGQEVLYSDTPGFPSILEVSVDDLPVIKPHHVLLIYTWVKDGETAITEFVRDAAPGDFHERLLNATFRMAKEGWPEALTLEVCMDVLHRFEEQDGEDPTKMRERTQQVTNAIRGAYDKVEATGGPSAFKPKGNKRRSGKSDGDDDDGPKVSIDRVIEDFLVDHYGEENLASLNGMPYHWDEKERRWLSLVNPDSMSSTWQPVIRLIKGRFAGVSTKHIEAGLKQFQWRIEPHKPPKSPYLIPFNNRILDVRAKTVRDIEREDYMIGSIPHDWDFEAKAPMWEEFLRHLCTPPDDYDVTPEQREKDHQLAIGMLEEFLGYCLADSYAFEKMLYLIGAPGTGKSTLVKVMQGLVPREWMTQVRHEDFSDPNRLVAMVNARFNFSPEVGRKDKDSDQLLLTICSSEPVPVKILFKDARTVTLPTRLVFHGNLMPASSDTTGAIARRTLQINTTDHKPKEEILEYHLELLHEAEGILARLVKAYARLLERGDFVKPSYSEIEAEERRKTANSAVAWVETSGHVIRSEGGGTPNEDLYEVYRGWSERFYPRATMGLIQWGGALTAIGLRSKSVRAAGQVIKGRGINLTDAGKAFNGLSDKY